MADQDMERLNRKVDEIAGKLDTLSASVDTRFGDVNTRFDAVDERFDGVDKRFDQTIADINVHFVEQRQYTELAFDTLRTEMREGFAEMRVGFAAVHSGFEQLDRRLAIFIETQGRINQDLQRRTPARDHARRRRKG